MSIISRIADAKRWYSYQALPAPSIILSRKAWEEVVDEIHPSMTGNGFPMLLGMRIVIDDNLLAGWELREDIGNRLYG